MANEPKINLALVGEMPENPVRGTVYMSPDTSGNFVKVGVDGSVRTIFDGSDYVRKDESVWIPGYGEKSAVLANDYSYATGGESVSHGYMTYARGENSHAEGIGCSNFPISVYSDFSNNIIYGAGNISINVSSYIGLHVSYEDAYATIIDAYNDKGKGVVFVLDKPLLDDGSDFMVKTKVYLPNGGVAAGECSHTEGDSTVAMGDFSHAEGFATYAGRINSHAEGNSTSAYGDGAHAEGCKTLAAGYASHTEGVGTTASGDYSHAEGTGTRASGEYSHAEGEGQEFSIIISGSAGVTRYTISGDSLADIKEGDIIRYQGIQQKAVSLLPYEKGNPDSGFAYAVITAVHFGKDQYIEVNTTLDSRNAITNGFASVLQGVAEGVGSHSEGYYTNAIGNYSHSEGDSTRALSECSHAEGEGAMTFGYSSHAEGLGTEASGDYSHTEGASTMTSGYCSHAEGARANASGDYSHAEGSGAKAFSSYSHAEGEDTTTSGYSSHAEGVGTIAFGEYSHVEGVGMKTFGSGSHAEGEGNRVPLDGVEIYGSPNTTTYTTSSAHGLSVNDIIYIDYETDKLENEIAVVVSVDTSTQFTMDNTLNPDILLDKSAQGTYMLYRLFGCAYGSRSHVEGVDTITLGDYSHAEGESTKTLGDYSHAEGGYTRTSNAYEHAQGLYNISHNYDTSFGNSGNTLNSIGVGVSDASRSNVIEVMQNGDIYVKGVGSYDGSNYVNASTLQEVLNSGGGGSVDSMTSITYANLKNLRDTSALIPGMQYRITDYECTTSQINTQSADNAFDIIVTADNENTLNENARACHHEGDTYFANCNLDAWELKYCLDNDADRFYWAYKLCVGFDYMDEETQKTYTFETPIGLHDTIPAFDMTDWTNTGNTFVDSLGNTMNESCKYRFNGTAVLKDMTCDNGEWTYSVSGSASTYRSITIRFGDGSGNSAKTIYSSTQGAEVFDGISGWYNMGQYRGYYLYLYKPNTGNITSARIIRLRTTSLDTTMRYDESDAKGVIYYMKDEWNNECPYDFKNIQFKRWAITEFERFPKLVIDINDEYSLYFGARDVFDNNILEDATYDESTYNGYFYTFASEFDNERLDYTVEGSRCYDNHISKAAIGIGANDSAILNNNVFFIGPQSHCVNNNLLNGLNNTFLGCNNNLFGVACCNNILLDCDNIMFGNICNDNILDFNCYENIFGSQCAFNIIGAECSGNTFGNHFSGNTLGDSCFTNTFGNMCTGNIFDSNISYSTVFDNVHLCHITGKTEQESIMNVQILNGTGGESGSDMMTIVFDNMTNYTQIAGVNSSGILKVWTPADLIY